MCRNLSSDRPRGPEFEVASSLYFGGEKREDEAEEKSHFSARCKTVTGDRDFPVAPSELSGEKFPHFSSVCHNMTRLQRAACCCFVQGCTADSPGSRQNMITARKAEPTRALRFSGNGVTSTVNLTTFTAGAVKIINLIKMPLF